jgi:hypothetical protein
LHDGFTPFERTDFSASGDVDQHVCVDCETLLENIQLALIETVCSPAQEFMDR